MRETTKLQRKVHPFIYREQQQKENRKTAANKKKQKKTKTYIQ